MGHKKLIRFAAIRSYPHVLEYPQDMAGKWSTFFGNEHPITLELACGKGEYALGLARLYPGGNYIGVDIKGNRIWVGATKALEENLKNVAFLRSQIEFLPSYFIQGEVKEIWITFPDPQLTLSRAKKRLTYPRFLRLYKEILAPDGVIHLKTDSPDLYHFTQAVIRIFDLPVHESSEDVYSRETVSDVLRIRTHYESLDIARAGRVHYLRFGLNDNLSSEERENALKDYLQTSEQNTIEQNALRQKS
jgi:tRNA (guanine-N7-)-methyltransferase